MRQTMGMRIRSALLVVLLSACNTPGTHFRGVPATRVTVEGSVFDVRVRGALAEAVRINPQYAPRLGPIRARAAFAMEKVSGCGVIELRGDQSLQTGLLRCKDRPAVWVVPVGQVSYSCLDIDQWVDERAGVVYTEFDCDPY